MRPDASRPVLLVHGAWHGAWCWRDVAEGLSARGVKTLAIDLPLESIAGDAETAMGALDGIGEPAVVCGHSYGGFVLSSMAASAVAHAVYLAAFMADEGEDFLAMAALAPPEATNGLGAAIAIEDGRSFVRPSEAAAAFYNDCPDDVAAWATQQLRAMPARTMGEPVAGPAVWRSVPSTYVVCEQDVAIPAPWQEVFATRADQVERWPTGHSPFLSAPERVVDLLAGLAARPAR